MPHLLRADRVGHFWWPSEFENVANPYLEHPEHLQNPVHLLLNKDSICPNDRHECVLKIEVSVF